MPHPRDPTFAGEHGRERRPRAGGAVLLAALLAAGCGGPPVPEGTNEGPEGVVILSIDTLRADAPGFAGGADPTPALDDLAARGTRFTTVVSAAPWTLPSHAALLTGRYPSRLDWSPLPVDPRADLSALAVLGTGFPTLGGTLGGAGFHTAAFVGGGPMSGAFGLNRGFEEWDESLGRFRVSEVRRVLDWLDGRPPGPFLLFLHTYELHAPYRHLEVLEEEAERFGPEAVAAYRDHERDLTPPGQEALLEELGLGRPGVVRALYRGGVRFVDRRVGDLVRGLETRGLPEKILLVVLSDHGEAFGEHPSDSFYSAHGHALWDELVLVPLLIVGPGFPAGREVRTQVRTVDLMPTILDAVGLDRPAGLDGRSLMPLSEGAGLRGEAEDREAISEMLEGGLEQKSLRTSALKYVWTSPLGPWTSPRRILDAGPLREQVFDLAHDPGETIDVAPARPELRRKGRSGIESYLRRAGRQR